MGEFAALTPAASRVWMQVPNDWRRPGAAESFEIFWDDRIGYGQILPRPSPEEVAGFYRLDAYYTHAARPVGGGGRGGLAARALQHLAWRLDRGIDPDTEWWRGALGAAPLRILEIGCGNGDTITLLRGLGHDAVGVEPDPAARAQARSAGHDVHAGTAEDLPAALQGRSFDVVVFMHVLEHCLDPVRAIGNARALLAPGGRCIAEVPNNACHGVRHFGPAWYWLDVPRHLNFFTGQSLRRLFDSAGFDAGPAEYRGYARQFGPGWRRAQGEIASRMRLGRRPSRSLAGYFGYLLATAWAAPDRKYDSVRLSGRLRPPPG